MPHKAETLMAAVQVLVTGLTTTGSNVERGRAYPHDNFPALSLSQGANMPLNNSFPVQDSELTVNIEAHVRSDTADTDLNLITREVFVAVMADRTVGGNAIDIRWTGDAEPVESGEGDKPIATKLINFMIHYRHSYTDPGA